MNMREWIRAVGKGRGLTQRRVGGDLGVGESTFSRLLRGELLADADLIAAAEAYTEGAVTAQDWHEVRLAWLTTQVGGSAAEGKAA